MNNSIVVYRVLSNTVEPDTNFSFQTVKALEKMGIVEFIRGGTQVYRTEDTTITVYNYRRAE